MPLRLRPGAEGERRGRPPGGELPVQRSCGATVAGRCVGPGDTLRIAASGVPTYEAGEIRLADLKLTSQNSAYFKLVAPLVQSALATASAAGPLRLKLSGLDVRSLRADPDRLVLTYDAALAVE